MKKLLISAVSALLLGACGTHRQPTAYVDPMIGTGGHGHTFPGATTPFGGVQLSPDTDTEGWDWCSGYHTSDSSLIGFSHTHLSGTGGADLGDILFMPATGPVKFEPGSKSDPDAGYRSRFSHADEKAEAGYYGVWLADPRVRAELTATPHTGVHRYTYETTEGQHLMLDLRHGIQDNVHSAAFRQVDDRTIEGWRRSNGWAADHTIYFRAEFSEPIGEIRARIDGRDTVATEGEGHDVTLAIYPAVAQRQLEVRVGISAVDLAGAAANLSAEAHGRGFDELAEAARREWDRALGGIRVEGGGDDDKTIFYTALYHAFTAPYLFTDVNGRYRGSDGAIHRADTTAGAEGLHYTLFSTWDTFRALHPLLSLVQPEVNSGAARSMLRYYEQSGRLPVWDLHMNETNCMIGYHAVPILADAFFKGQLTAEEGDRALEAMVHSAMQSDYGGLSAYRSMGYLPADRENNSVSKAAEYAYDDWCIAQMARALGNDSLYRVFIRRAQSYKNHFDPADGFLKGRLAMGAFRTRFDPAEISILGQGDFTEGNAWHYRFFVPQDVTTHIDLSGGDSAYIAALDAMFAAPSTTADHSPDVSGLIGQYAHGNEPSHQVAYLYSYAGAPWRTQERVAEIKRTLYAVGPEGLCGNEDCGQMSAWYVLSAMGFYPVTPGSGIYVLGTPTFERVEFEGAAGRRFAIRAEGLSKSGKNIYIQWAEWNGEPYRKSYITQSMIDEGGELVLHMGAEPAKDFGTEPADRPVARIPEEEALTSEELLAGVVFEPYIDDTTRVFADRLTLRPTCAAPQPRKTVYTLDGSEPTDGSPIVPPSGITLTGDAELKLRAIRPDGPRSSVKSYRFYKSVLGGASVTLEREPSAPYVNGGAAALVDGAMGGESYVRPEWIGFNGDDLAGVIDLGGVRRLRHVGFNAANEPRSWIVLPRGATFEFSTDGANYARPVTIAGAESRTAGSGAHYFGTAIPGGGVEARYIRFRIRNGVLPDWHIGKGNPAWMFVDEIMAY